MLVRDSVHVSHNLFDHLNILVLKNSNSFQVNSLISKV